MKKKGVNQNYSSFGIEKIYILKMINHLILSRQIKMKEKLISMNFISLSLVFLLFIFLFELTIGIFLSV